MTQIRSFSSPSLISHRCFLRRDILRRHVKSQHETVSTLELKRVRAFAVGFNLVRHHNEAVVARRPPILDVLKHRLIVGHSLKTRELDLSGFASVQRYMSVIFVGSPVNAALTGVEGLPFHRKNMAQ